MSETTDLPPVIQRVVPSTGFEGAHIYLTHSVDDLGAFAKGCFNLGLNVDDDPAQVLARRSWLEEQLQGSIQWLNQVHGSEVHQASATRVEGLPAKDASVTTSESIILAVLTADCLPVVFYAKGKPHSIGVAHAGWKGLAAGVLEATAHRVADLAQVDLSAVAAWMGPAIGPESFEVGPEVRDAFIASHSEASGAFAPSVNSGKYMADLYQLARVRMAKLNINVQGGGYDTLTDSTWFSHRGAQQNQGQPVGRFATLVRLVPSP